MELTAYILLAQLSKASLTQKEIAKATAIVAWLAKQRNAYGGFSSTQVNNPLSNLDLSGSIRSCVERGQNNKQTKTRQKNYCPWLLDQETYNSIGREEKHVKNI